jgi:hypothetical protein
MKYRAVIKKSRHLVDRLADRSAWSERLKSVQMGAQDMLDTEIPFEPDP